MITNNSILSNPAPLTRAEPASGTQAQALPQPGAKIDSTDVEFTGTGGEYFRIWIVNLLLIIVTFGIYLPWAKVRKLKYFYNNTHLDGHALDFHGEPKKMLRGTLIAGVLFAIYNAAANFSAVAGLIALAVLMAIAPLLFRAAMRFRLANTSWRGMRMLFTAEGVKGVYGVFLPPIIVLFVFGLILGLSGSLAKNPTAGFRVFGLAMGVGFLLILGTLPYFFWRLKQYQHNHYAWGPLKAELRSPMIDTYSVFFLTYLWVVLTALFFIPVMWSLMPSLPQASGKALQFLWILPLFFVFLIVLNILPRAYITAQMQNLLWSRTGNRYFRFKSELGVAAFIGLQFKNYFLIAITFGLYWPFAVINTLRMRLQAISLKTRIPLDKLTDAARARENDAAGDMAADIFGFDVGM
ncbi:MAG: DUF898 domain-containing protein [Brachymonas sp.]|nr:DUF898 domain-containing protein [Brachymonas sp.]